METKDQITIEKAGLVCDDMKWMRSCFVFCSFFYTFIENIFFIHYILTIASPPTTFPRCSSPTSFKSSMTRVSAYILGWKFLLTNKA